MICYACNTDYPQQAPEPFWVCPNCKSPKPFYEIKAPSLTIELKPRCKPENEPLHCAHVKLDKNGEPRACRVDGFEDHYECAVCGTLYCREHISEQELTVSQGTTLAICLACSQLSKNIQMKIRAFRLEINQS